MRKYLAILIVVTLIISMCAFAACDKGELTPGGELTLYVPDGAPALSVAKIVSDGKVGKYDVKTEVTTGENVVAKCASGEADLAVLPTNAAVKICNTRSDYQIFSVNVYGVLYIVGTEHIESISDLKGETLYSIGQANTPEYVFKTICDNAGVGYVDVDDSSAIDGNKVNILYQTDASTIIPQIIAGKVKFALIGEPAVTQLQNKAASLGKTVETLFDLQQEWKTATGSNEEGYPQASMIVKKKLLTNKFAEQLLKALQANSEFAVSHCDELNDIMSGAGSSLNLNYTAALLARCNLKAISASSAKEDIERYLSTFQAMAQFLPLKDGIIYEANN